jgi:hypothetical protein
MQLSDEMKAPLLDIIDYSKGIKTYENVLKIDYYDLILIKKSPVSKFNFLDIYSHNPKFDNIQTLQKLEQFNRAFSNWLSHDKLKNRYCFFESPNGDVEVWANKKIAKTCVTIQPLFHPPPIILR